MKSYHKKVQICPTGERNKQFIVLCIRGFFFSSSFLSFFMYYNLVLRSHQWNNSAYWSHPESVAQHSWKFQSRISNLTRPVRSIRTIVYCITTFYSLKPCNDCQVPTQFMIYARPNCENCHFWSVSTEINGISLLRLKKKRMCSI